MIRSISLASSGLASGPEGVEIEGRFGERQCLPNPLRHLHLVAAGDEVDVHDPRILMQQMIVEGR